MLSNGEMIVAYMWLGFIGLVSILFIAYGGVRLYKAIKAYRKKKRLSKFKVIDGGKWYWNE